MYKTVTYLSFFDTITVRSQSWTFSNSMHSDLPDAVYDHKTKFNITSCSTEWNRDGCICSRQVNLYLILLSMTNKIKNGIYFLEPH